MKITTNATHAITRDIKGTHSILVSGNAGGSTMTLGYMTDATTFVPFTDGAVEVGKQYIVQAGASVHIHLKVEGGTGIDVTVINGKL